MSKGGGSGVVTFRVKFIPDSRECQTCDESYVECLWALKPHTCEKPEAEARRDEKLARDDAKTRIIIAQQLLICVDLKARLRLKPRNFLFSSSRSAFVSSLATFFSFLAEKKENGGKTIFS